MPVGLRGVVDAFLVRELVIWRRNSARSLACASSLWFARVFAARPSLEPGDGWDG